MTNFDIIGVLRTYAASKGWVFLSGAEAYQNYEISQSELPTNKIIMGVRFTAQPVIRNKSVVSIRYIGVVMLGQKKETTTISELDETFIQKYDRRLLALSTLLSTTIGEVACNNELDVGNVNFEMILNRFDENIDCVDATLTLVQG